MRYARFVLPIVTLALAACTESKSEVNGTPPARPVLAQQVRYKPAVESRSFVATVRPRIDSDLGVRCAGKVARRLVEVGGRSGPCDARSGRSRAPARSGAGGTPCRQGQPDAG